MSTIVICDYCGEVVDDKTYAKISVTGDFRDNLGSTRYHSFNIGHFHTDPACYWRIKEAIDLVQETGPSIEAIPSISGQAVAARRRKHRPGEES